MKNFYSTQKSQNENPRDSRNGSAAILHSQFSSRMPSGLNSAFYILNLKLFALLFAFFTMVGGVWAGGATSYSETWTSVSTASTCINSTTTYTLTGTTTNNNSAVINSGVTCTITFPSAYASNITCTGGTFYGTTISGSITKTTTTISFPTPVSVPINSHFDYCS